MCRPLKISKYKLDDYVSEEMSSLPKREDGYFTAECITEKMQIIVKKELWNTRRKEVYKNSWRK